MRVVAIVQARMGSTRLPGKVLREVLGKPLLEWQVERLRLASRLDCIMVATSTNPADGAIEAYCRSAGISCYRGSESDVLDRYRAAARACDATWVVRVTGDCPLIDPRTVDHLVELFRGSAYDYASTDLERTYPLGMDAEIVSADLLDTAWREAVDPVEREHVTPFFYLRPNRFRLGNLRCDRVIDGTHRWTVDTAEDFELIRRLLTELQPRHPGFSLDDVLKVLSDNPSWLEINASVRQKTLGE